MMRLCWIAPIAFAALVGCSKDQPNAEDALPEKVELIFNTYLPPHEPMRRNSIDDFSRRIEEESGGSIEITIPGASLTKPDGQLSAVKDRMIDMAMVSIYASRAQLTLPILGDTPFNSLSGESASVAMWETQKKYFDSVGEFGNVKLLSMHVMPGFSYIGLEKPIRTIEDFEGTKIWASPGKPSEGLKAVGAIPVHSPFPQLFEYISKGTVDAASIGVGTVKQASLADHVRYMTRFPGGMGAATFAVVMNKDAWNSLSQEQQAAVLRAAEGLPRRTGRALDQRNRDALQEVDLEINDASPELVARTQEIMGAMKNEWIETAKARGLAKAEEAYRYYHQRMQEVYAEQQQEFSSVTAVAEGGE